MKKAIVLFTLFLTTQTFLGQNIKNNEKKEIEKVVQNFMKSIVEKDSLKFYHLFHENPVVWIGVFKDQTQLHRLKSKPTAKDYSSDTYKSFFRGLHQLGRVKEKYYNLKITNDDKIASVNFDFSFFENGIRVAWGKEIWGLIKTNNQWKITNVLFSYESDEINPKGNDK